MFWAVIWKTSDLLSENFPFWVVKFSTYLNRHVFVMAPDFRCLYMGKITVFHSWSHMSRVARKGFWDFRSNQHFSSHAQSFSEGPHVQFFGWSFPCPTTYMIEKHSFQRDCEDAQARLYLYCSHLLYRLFSYDTAHIILYQGHTGMYAQQRLRSACTSAPSDGSLFAGACKMYYMIMYQINK